MLIIGGWQALARSAAIMNAGGILYAGWRIPLISRLGTAANSFSVANARIMSIGSSVNGNPAYWLTNLARYEIFALPSGLTGAPKRDRR